MVLVSHLQYQKTSRQGHFDDVPEVFPLLYLSPSLTKSVPEPSVGCNVFSFIRSFVLSLSLSLSLFLPFFFCFNL